MLKPSAGLPYRLSKCKTRGEIAKYELAISFQIFRLHAVRARVIFFNSKDTTNIYFGEYIILFGRIFSWL